MFSLIHKHRVIGSILALIFAVALAQPVFADLTEEEQTIFSQNHVVFYEPCSDTGDEVSLSGEISISGDTAEEKVWSGLTSFLTPEQAAGVLGNMAYENGTYGPVRREGGQSGDIWNSSTQMGMGLIQWSFGRRVKLLNYIKSQDQELLKYFEDSSLGNMSGDDFIAKYGHETANKIYQLELQYLKQELDTVPKYHGIYDQKTVDAAADFFLEHVELPQNMVAQKPLRRASAEKMYTKYSGKTFTSNGVASSTIGTPDSTLTANINSKAWELADQTREASAKGPTEAYLQAQKSVKCPNDCYKNGESCDRFVSVVVRAAGVDNNIPWGDVATQENYMIATPNIYTRIEGDAASEAIYQPGDIRVKIVNGVRKHIEIYGQKGGKGYILSASNNDRWAGYTDFFADSGAEYHIYRVQGTPKCIDSGDGCAQNNMDLVGTTICLAHPLGTKHEAKAWYGGAPTTTFRDAIDIVYPNRKRDTQVDAGASSDVAVGTVVRYSGVDKQFPKTLKEDFEDIAAKGSDETWEVLKNLSKNDLQPGDIPLYHNSGGGEHIFIWLGEVDGEGYGAHAYYGARQGEYLGIEKTTLKDHYEYVLRAKDARNTVQVTKKMLENAGQKDVMNPEKPSGDDAKNTSNINAAAVELAWPLDTEQNKYTLLKGGDGVPVWREYYDSIYPKKRQTASWKKGASCSVWVSSVLMYAGVTKNLSGWNDTPIHSPKGLSRIFQSSNDWEKVDVKNASDYQPGDVMVWPSGRRGGEGHAAIYVEINGKGYTAQASKYKYQFGHIVDKVRVATEVWRYKGATSSGDDCDSCQPVDGDNVGLKKGGITLKEAKQWMETYRQEAAKKRRGSYMFQSAYVLDAGCGGGTLNNCVAFSQWFLNKYTSIGPSWANTANGDQMVNRLKTSKGLKTGNEPRPYAIFSTGTYNHTGVVMGLTNNSIVVCEASCSSGYTSYWPGCSEWSLETAKSKRMTYAYTDDILKPGAGGGGGSNW